MPDLYRTRNRERRDQNSSPLFSLLTSSLHYSPTVALSLLPSCYFNTAHYPPLPLWSLSLSHPSLLISSPSFYCQNHFYLSLSPPFSSHSISHILPLFHPTFTSFHLFSFFPLSLIFKDSCNDSVQMSEASQASRWITQLTTHTHTHKHVWIN